MKKASKILVVLMCLAMLFSIVACSKDSGETPPSGNSNPGGNTSAPPSGNSNPGGNTPASPSDNPPAASGKDTLRVAVTADAGTLDPMGLSSGGYTQVAYCYMEQLWEYTYSGEILWVLATGADQVSPTQYTVHIREGVNFSNGSPFTADDVLFTFLLWQSSPNRALPVSHIDLEKTSVVDKYTLDLHFKSPAINNMKLLSLIYVADDESYDPEAYSSKPVGTGPYVVTEYLVNSHMNAKARDDYWGEKPAIENLQFIVLSEESQRVNALVTNTADIAPVPIPELNYVSTLPGYNTEVYYSATATHVLFNVNEASIFSNLEARYAVCHAIDRNAISNIVYGGYAPVVDNPISMYAGDYEPRFGNLHETYSIGYDPALAKQYAESSGLAGKTIRIMTNGAPDFVSMAEIVQAGLGAIGVTAEINNYDQATLRGAYRTDPNFYDLCLYQTGSPDRVLGTLMQGTIVPSAILTESEWLWRDRVIELANSSLVTADDKERSEILYEMLQKFTEGCPFYGLCDTPTAYAFSADIVGAAFYKSSNIRFQELSFAG